MSELQIGQPCGVCGEITEIYVAGLVGPRCITHLEELMGRRLTDEEMESLQDQMAIGRAAMEGSHVE